VAVYFFDSSALVKRYVSEPGHAWVQALVHPTAGNAVHVAAISHVEVTSAVARRSPAGTHLTPLLARIDGDFFAEYLITDVSVQVIYRAVTIATAHRLRGYDAVQLACAAEVNVFNISNGLPPVTLISADAELNTAALAEGLAVDDPVAHP
jgi:hypothetical protein